MFLSGLSVSVWSVCGLLWSCLVCVWFICFYQVCVLLSGLAFVSGLCMFLPSLYMFLFGFCVCARFVYVSVWLLWLVSRTLVRMYCRSVLSSVNNMEVTRTRNEGASRIS